MRKRENESERWEEGDDFPTKTLPNKTKNKINGGTAIAPLQTPKNSSYFLPSAPKWWKKLYFLFFQQRWTFRILYRSDSQWGERKQGKEPSLSFSTSPPSLYLPTFISPLSPLPPSLLSPLSTRSYLYDILARRFASHSKLSFFSSVAFFLFSAVSFFFIFFVFGNMMKKKMSFCVDPSPSSSFLAGEEAMDRLKHQYLLEDYQELLKETEEKREKLQTATQKKLKLLAEVKFLTKKYESLANTSQAFPCKAKKQSYKTLSPSNQLTQPPCSAYKAELLLKERNSKSKETSVQTARKLIDLNQVFLPNDEEIDAFEVEWENQKMVKFRRSMIEDVMADDLNLSVYRDIGSGSNTPGKRKISWQDQLALRV